MRLSEEKIAHLAGRVVDRLWDDDLIDFKMQESRFRADVERVIFEDLKIEIAARYGHVGIRRRRSGAGADCSERRLGQPAGMLGFGRQPGSRETAA